MGTVIPDSGFWQVVFLFPLIGRALRALPPVIKRRCNTGYGSEQVPFPGYTFPDWQHAPDHPAIDEDHQHGERHERTLAAQDATGQEEGSKSVNQATGPDVRDRSGGQKDQGPVQEVDEGNAAEGDRAVKEKDSRSEDDKRQAIRRKVSPATVDQRERNNPEEPFCLPWQNPHESSQLFITQHLYQVNSPEQQNKSNRQL